MRRTRFDTAPCPIARATDLMGDWWTPLVLRDIYFGRRRFDDIQQSLQIPRAVLAARLNRLCEEAMLERVAYQDAPARYEYRVTQKGREFFSVVAAMWRWGSDWMWPDGDGPLVVLKDRETGAVIRPVVVDEATGERIDLRRIRVGRSRARPVLGEEAR